MSANVSPFSSCPSQSSHDYVMYRRQVYGGLVSVSVLKAFMLYGRTKLAHGLLSGKYSVPVSEVCLL